MKAISIFVFFLGVSIVSIYSQVFVNDWQKMELKGRVKYMEKCQYKPIEKDGKVLKGGKVIDNWLDFDEHIFFNEAGNITEEKDYGNNDTLKKVVVYMYNSVQKLTRIDVMGQDKNRDSYTLLDYNDRNNLVQSRKFTNDSILDEYSLSVYDAHNRLVEWNYFYEDILRDKWISKYDNKGRMIEQRYITSNDPKDVGILYTYKYDKKGNEIEYMSSDWYGGKSLTKCSARYNDHNKVIEKVYIKSNTENTIEAVAIYEYDAMGNVIVDFQIQYMNKQELIQSKDSYTYVYDSQGNWIQKISYRNDQPVRFDERKIEYF
jgi:hypothetical protein